MFLDQSIKDAITRAADAAIGPGAGVCIIEKMKADPMGGSAALCLENVEKVRAALGLRMGTEFCTGSVLSAIERLKRPEAASSTHRMSKRFARVGRALGFENATIVSDETIIGKIEEWQRRALDAERKVEELTTRIEQPPFMTRIARAAGISRPESAHPHDVIQRVEYLSVTAAAVNDVNRLAVQAESEARGATEKARFANEALLTKVARAAGISQPHTALETEVLGRVEYLAAEHSKWGAFGEKTKAENNEWRAMLSAFMFHVATAAGVPDPLNTKSQDVIEHVAKLSQALASRKTVRVRIPGVAGELVPHALNERIDKLEASVAELLAMHGRTPGAGARR